MFQNIRKNQWTTGIMQLENKMARQAKTFFFFFLVKHYTSLNLQELTVKYNMKNILSQKPNSEILSSTSVPKKSL